MYIILNIFLYKSRRRFDFRNWLNRLSVVYWARVIQREFSFIHSVWWAFGISAFFVFLCLFAHLFTEHSFHAHTATRDCTNMYSKTIAKKTGEREKNDNFRALLWNSLLYDSRLECIIIIFTYHFSSEGEKAPWLIAMSLF